MSVKRRDAVLNVERVDALQKGSLHDQVARVRSIRPLAYPLLIVKASARNQQRMARGTGPSVQCFPGGEGATCLRYL